MMRGLLRCGFVEVSLSLVEKTESSPDDLAGATVPAGCDLAVHEVLKLRGERDVASFAEGHDRKG
jgi:hypothetical protein